MGTDIHIAIEKLENGHWHWTAIQSRCDRNYDLFAILADVRNGTGFAGLETGAGFVPISQPRGWPADMDPQSLGPRYVPDESGENYEVYNPQTNDYEKAGEIPWEEYKERFLYRCASGDHSETWLLASEIFGYDYTQNTLLCGVMNEKEYQIYAETGIPTSYAADVSGGKIEVVTEPFYRSMRAGKRPRDPDIDYHIKTWWEVSYWECVGEWVDDLRNRLTAAGLTDFDKVRLVFNFDS